MQVERGRIGQLEGTLDTLKHQVYMASTNPNPEPNFLLYSSTSFTTLNNPEPNRNQVHMVSADLLMRAEMAGRTPAKQGMPPR